jgi:voltage-gated potassium channel
MAAITAVASAVLVTAAWAMWLLERHAAGANITTYPRALWWAMETITTVGYGDHHPVTTGGRLVAAGLMVVGLALVGVITATVVTWFFAELELVRDLRVIVHEEELEEATLAAVLERLRRIEAQLDALGRETTTTPG